MAVLKTNVVKKKYRVYWKINVGGGHVRFGKDVVEAESEDVAITKINPDADTVLHVEELEET